MNPFRIDSKHSAHGLAIVNHTDSLMSLPPKTVLKIYKPNEVKRFKNEVACLEVLRGHDEFPQILNSGEFHFFMNYCGEKLTKENRPDDWSDQMQQIIYKLKEAKVSHGDGAGKNILVLDGRIRLIDFSCGRIRNAPKNEYLHDLVCKMTT